MSFLVLVCSNWSFWRWIKNWILKFIYRLGLLSVGLLTVKPTEPVSSLILLSPFKPSSTFSAQASSSSLWIWVSSKFASFPWLDTANSSLYHRVYCYEPLCIHSYSNLAPNLPLNKQNRMEITLFEFKMMRLGFCIHRFFSR